MTDTQQQQLTAERGKVHGDFSDVAATAQTLKAVAKGSKNWQSLSSTQREGVDMILHKVARILCGDPNHRDHWDDIAGYAHITSIRITPSTTPKAGG